MPTVLQSLAGPVELVTQGEAADLLDVAPQTIRAYVMRGVLHSIRLARTAEYPAGTAFLLREELEWYDRRRRLGVPAAGPNPYAERYAELLDGDALAVTPLLDAQAAEMLARIRGEAPMPTPPPISTAEALDTLDGLDVGAVANMGWGALAALLFLLILAFILGRQPDAGKVAQLRAMPGAARLPRALREAADLLDKAA